ncbi:hypothetical protein J6590_003162 [Homalodisca vitripennis]|nr:hypothetical protein J6590_003162 [Homalodisca vitripennis]
MANNTAICSPEWQARDSAVAGLGRDDDRFLSTVILILHSYFSTFIGCGILPVSQVPCTAIECGCNEID